VRRNNTVLDQNWPRGSGGKLGGADITEGVIRALECWIHDVEPAAGFHGHRQGPESEPVSRFGAHVREWTFEAAASGHWPHASPRQAMALRAEHTRQDDQHAPPLWAEPQESAPAEAARLERRTSDTAHSVGVGLHRHIRLTPPDKRLDSGHREVGGRPGAG